MNSASSHHDVHAITIEGVAYERDELLHGDPAFARASPFHTELRDFLRQWFGPEDSLDVLTSGSTGDPKPMRAAKARMWHSAAMTCAALELAAGERALLCLPLRFIAGKMMVVRALLAGLDLWPLAPCANPLASNTPVPDFAAFTPMQVFAMLDDAPARARFAEVRRALIGGGAVDAAMAARLRDFPGQIYGTYGMTETLSHVALRRLSGAAAADVFYPMPGVRLSLSPENALIIDAPGVAETPVHTRDLAEILPDGAFRLQGRLDNVINSGGLKIGAEKLEELLAGRLPFAYAITSVPDARLGEAIVLAVTAGDTAREAQCRRAIAELVAEGHLPAQLAPRRIVSLPELPRTETGKPARARLKEAVRAACKP